MSKHRKQSDGRKRVSRRPKFLLPVTVGAVTAISATTVVGYLALAPATHVGAGLALADALQPAGRAVAVLEQQRQHLIVMSADAHSMRLVGSPSLSSSAPPPSATGSSGSGVNSGGPSGGGVPADPSAAQQIAISLMPSFGFSPSTEFSCLNDIWTRESGWRYNAENASGAYGIPQALPGDKMASAGSDWATDPTTQIRWGLEYIKQTYGTPCDAWGFWQAHSWY